MGMWDDEEEFRDVPEEAQTKSPGQQQPTGMLQPLPVLPQAPIASPPKQAQFNGATGRFEEPQFEEGEIEQLVESVLEDDEEDYTEVLNDANLRIEQGRLYQMIMNHDLFGDTDADPRAITNVTREIRRFVKERMEIMLGIRQEKKIETAMVALPFNGLEIDILKKLASKATNGATESPEANSIAEAVREVPRKQGLNPLSGSTGLKKSNLVPKTPQNSNLVPKTAQNGKTLPKTAAAPVKRVSPEIEQILAEEGVTLEELELDYKGMGRPFESLTDQEKAERLRSYNKRAQRHRTVKSARALPMATPAQEEMLAVQRATQIGAAPGMSALLAKVAAMPAKNT